MLTLRDIEDLAPDQASLKAAGKLLKPSNWPLLETDGDYIWGECQGSGANPYRLIFDLRDHGYKCTCPSRKFPCKHALAMGMLYAQGSDDFAQGVLPEWGTDWIGRRRNTGTAAKQDDDQPKPSKNLSAALAAEPEKAVDPKKAAAQEAARATRAAQTKAAQMAGLAELEDWITDNLSLGLPQVLSDLGDRFRTIAARMADAKAASLSGRLDEIPERIMSLPNAARADALIEEMGKLVLLSRAAQSDPQPAGVQRLISSADKRDAVLSDTTALRHRADWQVIASHTRSRKDGLVSYSTWLISVEETPRLAQLLDFIPASLGKRGAGFSVGEIFTGEICYYPSAFPIRAVIAERDVSNSADSWGPPQSDLATQVAQAVSSEPWIQDIPVLLGEGRLGQVGGGAVFKEAQSGQQLPLMQTAPGPIALGLDLHASAGLLRHGRLLLLASQTSMGVLHYDE